MMLVAVLLRVVYYVSWVFVTPYKAILKGLFNLMRGNGVVSVVFSGLDNFVDVGMLNSAISVLIVGFGTYASIWAVFKLIRFVRGGGS